jgi:hypothetical protein
MFERIRKTPDGLGREHWEDWKKKNATKQGNRGCNNNQRTPRFYFQLVNIREDKQYPPGWYYVNTPDQKQPSGWYYVE